MALLFLHSWFPGLSWLLTGFVSDHFALTGEPDGGAWRVRIGDDDTR